MQEHTPTRPAWSPLLFDWAFRTLEGYAPGERREEFDRLSEEWSLSRIVALHHEAMDHPVQVLGLLQRWESPEKLAPEIDKLRDELSQKLTFEQALDLGRLSLDSGFLRLAEQEDLRGMTRVRILRKERDDVLRVRSWLLRIRTDEDAQVDKDQKEEARKLLRRLGRLAKKLGNAADEARLQLRLERVFGPGRVRWFSRVTFFSLIGLLFLLILDGFVPEDSEFQHWLLLADTALCCVFLWEFLVRVLFAPRRLDWVRRHFLTDFLPAIPFGLLMMWSAPKVGAEAAGASWAAWITGLRLVRIPLYARYIRFLRPLVSLGRLLIFWLRGMDRLVSSMAPVLNRKVVLFEAPSAGDRANDTALGSQIPADHRVSHDFERLSEEMRKQAAPALLDELRTQVGLYRQAVQSGACVVDQEDLEQLASAEAQMMRAEDLLESLENLRAEEVEAHLPSEVVSSLGRILALADLPLLRSLPFIGPVVRAGKGATSADRVAHAGRCVGGYCNKALAFVAGWADLSGVLTAPQILDRIASAMQRSTQRPAVRLLLFGFLFLLVKLLLELLPGSFDMPVFLERFVGIPLLSIGIIALILLVLAKWLKRIAGEASDRLLRSAEARYVNLLELDRRRFEETNRARMVDRVLVGNEDDANDLDREIQVAMDELRRVEARRNGQPEQEIVISKRARRLSLLLLDSQDGAFFHGTDTKGCEQFLSHPDLWSLRQEHLKLGAKEERRLGKLDLANGGVFSGPFLWFDLLTHATGLVVARLVSSYNLYLLSLEQRPLASPVEIALHNKLLAGDGDLRTEPDEKQPYRSGYFHVLHFLSGDEIWSQEVERDYGPEVLARLQKDRRILVRTIFGTRPLHKLDIQERSLNLFDFYHDKFGGGRILLLPWRLFTAWFKMTWMLGRMAWRSAKDILDPRLARQTGKDHFAPFPVVRRKLYRMKKPLLQEVLLLAARVDPCYLGLDEHGQVQETEATWRADVALIDARPSEMDRFLVIQGNAARRLLYLPGFLDEIEQWSGQRPEGQELTRLRCAFAMDEQGIASLWAAEERARAWLYAIQDPDKIPAGDLPRAESFVRRSELAAGYTRMLTFLGTLSWRERRHLARCRRRNSGDFRLVCRAFARAGAASPRDAALQTWEHMKLRQALFLQRLETLRAITALLVQDLRHHEELLYQLGGYADPTPEGGEGLDLEAYRRGGSLT